MAGLPGRTNQIRAMIVLDTNVLDTSEQNALDCPNPTCNRLVEGYGSNHIEHVFSLDLASSIPVLSSINRMPLGKPKDWAKTSVYLFPEPVLNNTTRSDGLRNPVSIR
jgi:hypothetical protein